MQLCCCYPVTCWVDIYTRTTENQESLYASPIGMNNPYYTRQQKNVNRPSSYWCVSFHEKKNAHRTQRTTTPCFGNKSRCVIFITTTRLPESHKRFVAKTHPSNFTIQRAHTALWRNKYSSQLTRIRGQSRKLNFVGNSSWIEIVCAF